MIDFKIAYEQSKDLNVLYVENVEDLCKSTVEILKKYFAALDIAIDGLEGIEKYKTYYAKHKSYYDLVISDIEIPGLNGMELSDIILEINSEQMIMIISEHNDPMYLFELINLGIAGFLSKPIKIKPLHRAIYRISKTILTRKEALVRQEYEKTERKFLLGVMDLQDNIIVITDGHTIESANQALLDFFDFKTVDDFKQAHTCICHTFINAEGYFHLTLLRKDELWVEHILQKQNQDLVVMMKNAKNEKEESFKVSVNYFTSRKKYIVTFSNISKIALKNKIDQHNATHDSLTGIYNRYKLNEFQKNHFSLLGKTKADGFSIILFDIDNFKKINDTYGHLTGDKVLKQLTSLIQKHIRSDDLFIRWGGDEFILIIEEITSIRAMKIAKHLCHIVAQHIFNDVGPLTCSFGVTQYQNNDTLSQIMTRADRALYKAKNSGRNKVSYL